MVDSFASLAQLSDSVGLKERTEFLPRWLGALQQKGKHGQKVRLAAAEAAVDEAPIFLTPVEDLFHIVQDGWQLPLNYGRDDVVIHQFAGPHPSRARPRAASPRSPWPDVLRLRQIEDVGDGGHGCPPRASSFAIQASKRGHFDLNAAIPVSATTNGP